MSSYILLKSSCGLLLLLLDDDDDDDDDVLLYVYICILYIQLVRISLNALSVK